MLTMSKRGFAVIAVTAVLMIATGVLAQEDGETGSWLVIPERVKDLGTVPQGEVVDTEFELRNEGAETLVISAVRPTCGCTVVEFDREVAAGQTGFVKAKLDTTGFRGRITKSIFIVSNDAESPTSSVVLRADVQPFLDVYPRPLVKFRTVQYEQASERVTLAGGTSQGFTITGMTTSASYISATHRKLEDEELLPGKLGDQYEITVTLGEDAPPGPLKGIVTVATDHPKAKKVKIDVYGVIRALVQVTPSELQFGSIDPSLNLGRNLIVVNNRPNQSLRVTAAEVDDPAFTTEIMTIDEGQRFQVTVKVNPDADAGSRDATLTVYTTDPQFPEMRVPVRAHIE